VAPTDEEFVDRDHRGASDDGDGRHDKNCFGHDSLPADFNANTPEESCSRKTRELRGRAINRESWVRRVGKAKACPPFRSATGDRWWARR